MAWSLRIPNVTITRLDVSAGQESSVQELLRGLKRPRVQAAVDTTAQDRSLLSATAVIDQGAANPSEPPLSRYFEGKDDFAGSLVEPEPFAGDGLAKVEAMGAPKLTSKVPFLFDWLHTINLKASGGPEVVFLRWSLVRNSPSRWDS